MTDSAPVRAENRWITDTLGGLATYINGRAFKPEEWGSEGLPIIRIENLTDPDAPANHFAGPLDARHRVENGDLLVSWSATLDVFWWDRGPGALNQHIFKVEEDRSKVDRLFLYFLLKSVMEQLRQRIHGSTMKHVTKPKFEGLEVRLPADRSKQRRIADELGQRVAGVQRAARALLAQQRASRALVGAVIDDAFRESGGEATGTLGDVLAGPPRAGWSPFCDDVPGGVPILTLSSVTGFTFRPEEVKHTSEPVKPDADYWAREGDLLMTRSNTAELVGHVAIAHGIKRPTIFPDLLLRLPLDLSRVRPEFAHTWLMGTTARNFIRAKARGSSGTMKKVNQSIVRAIPFPTELELAQQEAVVHALAPQLAAARRVEAAAARGREAVDALAYAVIREAFDIPNLDVLTDEDE